MSDKKDDISSGMYGGYISKVAFNNGQSIDINKNDIVIFVGPNNVGKSQALKDIYALCKNKEAPIVVSDIEIVKYDTKPEELLKTMSVIAEHTKGLSAEIFSGVPPEMLRHLIGAFSHVE